MNRKSGWKVIRMSWVDELRSEFPTTKLCTYLDNAYDCGGSLIAKRAAMSYFDVWSRSAANAERGGAGRESFLLTAEKTRELIAQLLGGVSPREIAFTRNTNEGINLILYSYDFQKHDNIVVADREYSSTVIACVNASQKRGFQCRIAGTESYFISEEVLLNAVDENTRFVFVSHVQSSTGYKIDIGHLAKICRERDIYLIVDATQSMGLAPVFPEKWGVSAVTAASYKGLFAFISTGFLYCSTDLLRELHPAYLSDNGFAQLYLAKEKSLIKITDTANAGKLENASDNLLGIWILHDTVSRILEIGIENIYSHISELYEQLYSGLEPLGYSIITPREEEHRCASLSLSSPRAEEIVTSLREESNVIISGRTVARFSIGAYTTAEDIDRGIRAAAKCSIR